MNDVVIPYFTAVLIALGVVTSVLGESDQEFAPECTSWKTIKKELEESDKISCAVVRECTGLNCSGQYNGHNFKAEVIMEACDMPPRLNTTFDIPFLNVHNFQQTFTDGKSFTFPYVIDAITVSIEVSMKKKNQTIYLSLTLKPKFSVLEQTSEIPILRNATISVPRCHNDSYLVSTKPLLSTSRPEVKRMQNITSTTTVPVLTANTCSEVDMNECGEKEICVRSARNISECRCIDGFVRNAHLECIPFLSFVGKKCNLTDLEASCEKEEICVQYTTGNLTGSCHCRKEYHDSGSGQCIPGPPAALSKKTMIIVLACVIPISLLLLSVAVVLAFKFRLIPRLRERFNNVRTYEVVSIGNDDDEPLVA